MVAAVGYPLKLRHSTGPYTVRASVSPAVRPLVVEFVRRVPAMALWRRLSRMPECTGARLYDGQGYLVAIHGD